jgi:hypothetical protein
MRRRRSFVGDQKGERLGRRWSRRLVSKPVPRYRVSVPPPPLGRKRRRWRGWRWWCWRTRREAGRSGMVASARTEASATLQSVGRARQRANVTPRVFPIAHIFMQKVSTIASLPLLRRLLLQLLSRCITNRRNHLPHQIRARPRRSHSMQHPVCRCPLPLLRAINRSSCPPTAASAARTSVRERHGLPGG